MSIIRHLLGEIAKLDKNEESFNSKLKGILSHIVNMLSDSDSHINHLVEENRMDAHHEMRGTQRSKSALKPDATRVPNTSQLPASLRKIASKNLEEDDYD